MLSRCENDPTLPEGGCDTVKEVYRLQKEILKEIDGFKKAFVGDDLDGHRRYHQTVIEMLEERRKLRLAIQEKTITGLVWVFLCWLVAATSSEIANALKGIAGVK